MQDFLNKLKHFMDDRYGVDDLSCALGALGVIIALLGALLKVGLFTWIAIIVIVLAIVRAISKNFPARERENDQFRQLTSKAPALDGFFDKLPFKHGAERHGARRPHRQEDARQPQDHDVLPLQELWPDSLCPAR